MKAGNWFRFSTAANDESTAEIHIIDFIGDWYDDAVNRFWGENIGVTARAFVEALSNLPASVKAIRVHLNSPGGDVQAGINIANALRAETAKGRTVETIVDGVAASIASVIAMAGTKVVMADNALMMIHDPMTIAIGNAAEFEKAQAFLATAKAQIIATYKWHATIDEAALAERMTAETWLTADEAIAIGLATDKIAGLSAAATLSKASLAKLKVPEQHRARVEALIKPDPAPAHPFDAAPIVTACAKAGMPELAEPLVTAKATMQAVEARIAEERQVRAARAERETAIRGACAVAKAPEFADTLVKSGMSVADVKAHLVVLKARLDAVNVDGSLNPDQPVGGRRTVDRAAAYRNFTQQPTA